MFPRLSSLSLPLRPCSKTAVPNVGFFLRVFYLGGGYFLFVLLIIVQRIEPRALCTLSKCPSTELHTQSQITGLLAALCTFLASGQDSLREATGVVAEAVAGVGEWR